LTNSANHYATPPTGVCGVARKKALWWERTEPVAVVEHRGCAVEAEPVKPEVFNPPTEIGQQEPQHLPPAPQQPAHHITMTAATYCACQSHIIIIIIIKFA